MLQEKKILKFFFSDRSRAKPRRPSVGLGSASEDIEPDRAARATVCRSLLDSKGRGRPTGDAEEQGRRPHPLRSRRSRVVSDLIKSLHLIKCVY